MGNALKFTHEGHVLIDVSGRERNGKVQLRIAVEDTGIGIPADKLDTVFEQFTQAESATTRRYGGTGLGLSISKRFVELMGGQIGVDSVHGEGSTFWLELELEPLENEAPVPQATFEGRRVLVVDDMAVNRTILQEQLTAWGIEVVAVPSGQAALVALEDAHSSGISIDLAVLDLQMPQMDGAQLASRMAQTSTHTKIPIVVLSSASREVTSAAFEGIDHEALMTKPVRIGVLRAELAKVLGPPEPALEPHAQPTDVATETTSQGRRVSVLVAEDNPVNRKIVENMLRDERYALTFAENGHEAYGAFRKSAFDVVLMDVSMPEMDGIEATQAIRAFEATSKGGRTPIVALTAHAMSGDRERFIAAGMDDYLTKPIKKTLLVDLVSRFGESSTADLRP